MWNIYIESYDLTRTSCIFLFSTWKSSQNRKKCVCDVCQLSMDLPCAQTPMCLGLVRLHTHVVIIYAPCPMFSGCVGPLLWSTYKYISVQETAARNMGSLLIRIFSIVENTMPFPPNLPLSRGSLLPFWRTGDCSVRVCVCVCISDRSFAGTKISLRCPCATTNQRENPSSLRWASSVAKTVGYHLVSFF